MDLETDGLIEDVSVVWCGAFVNGRTDEERTFGPDEIPEMLEFIASIKVMAAHNGIGYDLKVLKKLYDFDYKGRLIDTLLLSKLLRPNRFFPKKMPVKKSPHSINAWGYRVGRGKPEHDDWTQYSDEMLHRCVEDTHICKLAHEYMVEREMVDGDWSRAIPLTMKLFDVLEKSQDHGWLVDQDHMHKSVSMLNHWVRKIDNVVTPMLPMRVQVDETKVKGIYKYVKKPFLKSRKYSAHTLSWFSKELYHSLKTALGSREEYIRVVRTKKGKRQRMIGGPYCRVSFRLTNLNSGTEVKEFLLAEGWQPKEWNTNDEGEPTSPKLSKSDPFVGIEGGVGRLVARRVQCRHRKSTIEGWFTATQEDGRVRQRVTGLATTGRAKHSTIVNVPNGEAFFGRWMRQCFTVPADRILVGVDSAGCQNRMLAARVGDDNFTKILLEGTKEDKTSIHYVNMRALASYNIEASYGQCKNANYAFMFGASDNKLGKIIPGNDGTVIREALLSVSAGFEQLVLNLQEEWRSNAKMRKNKWGRWEYFNGWLPGLDGRPIYIASEHTILVYMLQSDEAIMMQYAYMFLYSWLTAKGLVWGEDWAYVAWNHDEYQIECKPEHEEVVIELGEKAIAYAGEYLQIACPHAGEADVGKTWYDTH